MNVFCTQCGSKIRVFKPNFIIIGPNLQVSCPICRKTFQQKLNKFAYDQVWWSDDHSAPLERTRMMQKIARKIELSVSDYYKKKGKQKANE